MPNPALARGTPHNAKRPSPEAKKSRSPLGHCAFTAAALSACALGAQADPVTTTGTGAASAAQKAAPRNGQVATITAIEGRADIFTHPAKTPTGPVPHGKFGDFIYSVRAAKVGDRVERGNLVRTNTESKVRVVYPNGDQFLVGPGTSYRVDWKTDSKDPSARGGASPEVNLLYGKLRGIIESGGPRTGLKVRSRSVVMGVRGTDFFIGDAGAEGKTEISVLRGKVEVATAPQPPASGASVGLKTPSQAAAPKPIEVGPGFSVEIAVKTPAVPALPASGKPETAKAPEPEIVARKTTQQEFQQIFASSHLAPPGSSQEARNAPDDAIAKEVAELEKTAVQTALSDIQKHDPELYARLDGSKMQAPTDIAAVAVRNLAPSAPLGRSKPRLRDLSERRALEAYERYEEFLGK